MHKLPVFLIALFVLSCSASPDTTYEVSLKAGAVDRHATPVSAMIEASAATETTPVCVRSDTHEQPGQVHRTAEEQTEVWWLADLPAGEAATYTLDLGSDCSEEAFTWSESAGDATQLSFGNRPVIEYVHPTYDPDAIDETLKPFHHVFAPDGSQLLTKGPGGLYPHHRGIFFGYNRIEVNDQELNTWGSGNGEHQSHEEIVERFAGPVFGGHTVRIEWKDRSGEPFIEELRTLRVFRQSDDALLVDFSSRLEPLRGTVRLDGDRQHAGVQFRAAQDVADNAEATRFIRPSAWSHLPPEEEYNGDDFLDLPWNAISYPLGERHYTVAYFSGRGNPDGAAFSERSYGRFGEFFPYELTEDRPLEVNYRWWIVAREDVEPEEIDQKYREWATPPSVQVSSN